MAVGAQDLAQAPDVNVDGTFFDVDLIAPDLIQQLAAAENALGVGDEEMQQAKFGGAEAQSVAAGRDAMGLGIEP